MLRQIILLIVGGIITLSINYLWENFKTSVKEVDYKITKDIEFISTPEIPEHKVEIYVDTHKKKLISRVQVDIFNFSDKDFKKIPIYVSLKTKDKKPLNVILSYEESYKNIPSSVEKITDKKLLPKNDSSIYGYEIKLLKRTSGYATGLKVVYLIDGKIEDPIIEVFTTQEGVVMVPFDYTHSSATVRNNILATLLLIGLIIILTIIIIFFVVPLLNRLTYPLDKKPRLKYSKELSELLKQNSIMQSFSLSEIQSTQVVNEILYLQRKNRWNLKKNVVKWIDGLVEPKQNDYID